jgi:hypothetical protein
MTVPFEPDANSRKLAKFLRNLYAALLEVGFTENETLQIIGVVIAAGANRGKPSE